jgi:hypothetical protein
LSGKAIRTMKRSPSDKDGGSDPIWEHDVEFEIVDQYLLDVEVFHQNQMGAYQYMRSHIFKLCNSSLLCQVPIF